MYVCLLYSLVCMFVSLYVCRVEGLCVCIFVCVYVCVYVCMFCRSVGL